MKPSINPFNRHHFAAWRGLRDYCFKESEMPQFLQLYQNDEYLKIANETIHALDQTLKKDEDSEELKKIALQEISTQYFQDKQSKTRFDSVYHVWAYAQIYGPRSIAALNVAFLEYLLDPSNAMCAEEIKLVDLGTGTAASLFGALFILNEYARRNPFFKKRIKKIKAMWVENNEYAHIFCLEFTRQMKGFRHLPGLEIAPAQQTDISQFLKSPKDGKFDIIIASKSLSEAVAGSDNKARGDMVRDLLNCLNEEGVFLFLETADKKKFISDIIRDAAAIDFIANVPCLLSSNCSKSECWAWRDFGYDAPDRPREKFFSVFFSASDHFIFQQILKEFPVPRAGQFEYVGPFDPWMHHCQSDERFSQPLDPRIRGRFLFRNDMGEEWIFCIDRKDYWQKIVRSEQCMPGKIEIL